MVTKVDPFQRGYDSWWAGIARMYCPFPRNTSFADKWLAGHDKAQSDAEADKDDRVELFKNS